MGEAVLTSTHNLCFGAKIRKIGIPLQTPCYPDVQGWHNEKRQGKRHTIPSVNFNSLHQDLMLGLIWVGFKVNQKYTYTYAIFGRC